MLVFHYCMLFSHIPLLHAIQSHSTTACYSVTFHYCMLFSHIPLLHAIQSHSTTAYYSVTFHYCILFSHIPLLHAIQSHSTTAYYSVTFHYCMLFSHIPVLHANQLQYCMILPGGGTRNTPVYPSKVTLSPGTHEDGGSRISIFSTELAHITIASDTTPRILQ